MDIIFTELRDITYDEAKSEIIEYIKNNEGQKIYISKIAEELNLDIATIIMIYDMLKTENRS